MWKSGHAIGVRSTLCGKFSLGSPCLQFRGALEKPLKRKDPNTEVGKCE